MGAETYWTPFKHSKKLGANLTPDIRNSLGKRLRAQSLLRLCGVESLQMVVVSSSDNFDGIGLPVRHCASAEVQGVAAYKSKRPVFTACSAC